MMFDPVQLDRDLRRRGQAAGFHWSAWVALAVLSAFSLFMYLWEFANVNSDLYKHAVIASEFVFTDLHSITSRLAYPVWHLLVAALFQIGMPLSWAAALVCAVCKGLLYLLVIRYVTVMSKGQLTRGAITVVALLMMLVTPVRIAAVNADVYKGIGSPTVWHNPTQLAVLVTAMLCVPYTVHCWYVFVARLPHDGANAMLPWRKVIVLALLSMVSLACKPTFMQALIPAAAIFFLWQWIQHPKNSRYFLQIILAFVPAVAYFMLQYLYYTGVVVPYTSGVSFGASWQDVWLAIRNMLLMSAFPLFALACSYQKGMFKNAILSLTLLMVLFSVLEAMFFRETGVRLNHGNFNWASMSSSFMLWVVSLPPFVDAIGRYRERRLWMLKAADDGSISSGTLSKVRAELNLRSAAFFVSFVLLLWHVYSGGYYIYYLLSTGSTF